MPNQTRNRGRQGSGQSQAGALQATTEAEEQKRAMTVIARDVAARSDQLAALLAGSIDVDRFITVALQAVQSQPSLLKCTPLSILGAIRDAATYGVEPAGMLGDAAIVPYKGIATLRLEYRGLRKLALRDKTVAAVDSDVVYEGDDFFIASGSESRVHHVPDLKRDEKASVIGAYAWARLANGELLALWMPLAEILQRRDASPDFRRAEREKTYDSIWHKWPKEQMKKTPLRRLIVEKLPMTPIAREAIAKDTEIETKEISVIRPSSAGDARARVLSRMGLGDGSAANQLAAGDEKGAPETETGQGDTKATPAASSGEKADPAAPGASTEPKPAAEGEQTTLEGEIVLCHAPSPYPNDKGNGCLKPKGHAESDESGAKMHKGANGETWAVES